MNEWFRDLTRGANLVEAWVWFAFAAGFAAWGVRANEQIRRSALLMAVTFAAFGVSDLIESRSGAWWRPWWLLVWKGACLAALACCGWKLWRSSRRPPSVPPDER